MRFHLCDRGDVEARCVIESPFHREHKVPAVIDTGTGVCVLLSELVCGHHTPGSWSAVVSCRRLHSLIKQPDQVQLML